MSPDACYPCPRSVQYPGGGLGWGSERFQLAKDRSQDRIRMLQHFIVRRAQNVQAKFLQASRRARG